MILYLALLAAPNTLEVQMRLPLALVLATPTGDVANISNSEIIDMLSEILRRHTDFSIEVVDERSMEQCRGRLYCLAEEARAAYPYARFMLLLTNVAIEGEADRVTAVLLDTDKALALYHESPREPGWRDRIEATVSEQAVIASTPRREIEEGSAARDFLERLVTEDLRAAFEAHGRWEAWGSISFDLDESEPFEIAVDERTVGTTAPGANELLRVSEGEHRIRFRHPDFADAELSVSVQRGARAVVEPDLVRTRHELTILRPITAWTGLFVAIGGAAIVTVALVRQENDVRTACFDPEICSHDGFATFSYSPSAIDAKNVNPPGVLMAPLGYSLVAAGAAWSLGTVLFGDDDDVPWIQWIAGLAIGAAAYGISVAAGG